MNNAINADTITDEQIEALRKEAAVHGDLDLVADCDLALHPVPELSLCRRVRLAHRAKARAECARVIADAQAQDDSDEG